MVTGLVVGKFCPLHRGHEGLIAFARANADQLVILSYTNPDLGYPVAQRAGWLAALFPDTIRLVIDDDMLAPFARRLPANDAPDAEHRAFCAWACDTLLNLSIDRVFTSEAYGDGFAAALACHFGRPVDHIPYDLERRLTPISGTALRRDPATSRRFLSDAVRADLPEHYN